MVKKSTLTPSTAEADEAATLPERRWWDPVRLGRRSFFPLLPQAVALGVLIYLILAGWGRHGIEGIEVEGPLLYTNLATLGFWVVWFMLLILFLPVVGRLWCTVCPVGWCNDMLARIGMKRAYPRGLRNFAVMAVLLFGLSLVAELYAFNRYPDYTARLLLGVLLTAALAGLLFKDRVFCRYLCPIGGMAGLYGRMAPWEVGSRDPGICRRCESKACYTGCTRWHKISWSGWHSIFPLRQPGCPAAIFPPEAALNDNCLMCTQCFKNCPYDNLRWGVRPFLKGLWHGEVRDRSQALLVIVLTGIVFYRLARFWGDLRDVVEWPAVFLASNLPFVGPTAFNGMKLAAGFALWPLLFFLALALIAKVVSEIRVTTWPAGGDETAGLLYDVAEIDEQRRNDAQSWEEKKQSLWGYLAVFSFSFVPLIASGYAAFALVKLNEKIGHLPIALSDPVGVRSYLAMTELSLVAAPESLVPLEWLRWVVLSAVAVGAVASLWSVGRVGAAAYGPLSPSARRGGTVFRFGIFALSAIMLVCVRVWLFRG
jgi:polyferredoxin